MAYQQPTAFFSKPTELTSEDFLNGVRTQDAAETFRRKRALADAFSASITTKPVIADEDKIDANGNLIQRKGDILARPGDVDQQKFFEYSAKAGLGFDEAKAVYDHYQMQKGAALTALKQGNEISALGGGTGVEGRAGAPVYRDQPAPQPVVPQAAPTVAPVTPAPATAPTDELAGLSDEKKIDKLTAWMNSRKKDLVAKAQAVLGVPVDGISGRKTKLGMDAFKAALIKSNLQKDVTESALNRVDIIAGAPSKGEEGKLVVDGSFNTVRPSVGSVADTRTSLQVIEDRAGANNFGQGNRASFAVNAPKLADFGAYKANVKSVLAKNGLPVSDAGIQQYLQNAADAVGSFVYDPSKSVAENRAAENKNVADKQAAVNKAREGLASGIDTVKGQALAADSNRMARESSERSKQERDLINEGLADVKAKYGADKVTIADLPRVKEIGAKIEKTKKIVERATEFVKWAKEHPNATAEERSIQTKTLDNLISQSDNIATESGRTAFFSNLARIAPSWRQAIFGAGEKPKMDAYKFVLQNIGELPLKDQAQMYLSIGNDLLKYGSAAAEMKPYQSSSTGGARKQLEDNAKAKKRAPVRNTEGM